MEDFVAHESRSTLVLVLVMAGAIFLSGLWMGGILGAVPHSPRFSGRVIFVVGWCLVLFSGTCGFVIFKSFVDPGEVLRIGPQGIRFANWSEDTIPWSEITRVTTWRGQRQKVIALYLRSPDRFPGRGLASMSAADMRNYVGGDIFLNLDGTDRNFEDAIAAIQRFKPVG